MTNSNVANIKFVNSENKFSIYSNNTAIVMSAFDIRLLFGQTDVPEHSSADKQMSGVSEMTVIQQGSVTMSPVHAKLFSQALQSHVENYESMFGKINTPPDIAPMLPKPSMLPKG